MLTFRFSMFDFNSKNVPDWKTSSMQLAKEMLCISEHQVVLTSVFDTAMSVSQRRSLSEYEMSFLLGME